MSDDNLTNQLRGSIAVIEPAESKKLPVEAKAKAKAPANLVEKLAAACDAVGGVAKLGKNEQQNYAYVKAADIAKAIRHELFSRGIMLFSDEQPPEFIVVDLPPDREGKKRSMTECHLAVRYLLTDGNESLQFMAYGVARDSGDKAIYKAKTGALKYFLRGLGLIPDEKDDPEFDEQGKEIVRRTPEEQKQFADEKIARMKAQVKTPPKPSTESITPAQRKRLWAISKERHWEEAALRDLLGSYGFEHTAEVTMSKYDEIIRTIQEGGSK